MHGLRTLTTLLCGTALACAAQARAAEPSHPAQRGLQLAMGLTPASLAGTSAQHRLLEALEALLDEHPDVVQARAARESAYSDVETARSNRWPKLKVGTSSGSAAVAQGERRVSYNAVNAEVRMRLVDGGAVGAEIRAAESQAEAQDSALHSMRQNVLLEALTALVELQRYEDKVRIAAESAEIIAQLARVEERRAELGAVGRNDLGQAASRRASAQSQQHALEAQRDEAQARFVRYFNYRPDSPWLPALQPPPHWLPATEAAARDAAEAHSSELVEADHQVERARAEVERAKAERWPTLAAVVSHSHDPKGILYNAGTRYGMELNWNFGSGFELRDRILKATHALESQLAQRESVRRVVHETASTAWARWEAGRKRQAELQLAVREARGAFEGYRRLLEMGRGSLSQVLDAQLDMQRLMLDEVDAIHDQRIHALRLARTTGQLLPRERPDHWLVPLFLAGEPPAGTPVVLAQAAAGAPRLRLRLDTRLRRLTPPGDASP